MDDVAEARRKRLEAELKRVALDLFEHMPGASSFLLPLDGGSMLIIAAGPRDAVLQLLK